MGNLIPGKSANLWEMPQKICKFPGNRQISGGNRQISGISGKNRQISEKNRQISGKSATFWEMSPRSPEIQIPGATFRDTGNYFPGEEVRDTGQKPPGHNPIKRTQDFAADPVYVKGEVFAYVGLPQNLKDPA